MYINYNYIILQLLIKSLLVAIVSTSLVIGLPTPAPEKSLEPVQRQKKQ